MAKTDLEMLEEITTGMKTANELSAKEMKALTAAMEVEKKAAETLKADVEKLNTELKAKDTAITDILGEVKELKAKSGRIHNTAGGQIHTLRSLLVETITKHKDAFAAAETKAMDPISFGKGIEIVEQKAVGNIASANLTGTGNNYISYLDWQPGMEPTGQFRFRSIFGTINSETDFVRFPRANVPIGEGSFARVAEAATKPQVDRDYTMIDLTLTPMAGYAIVSRQSLRNIVFLQSWLPTSMMEQLEDAEDTDFANKLVAAATGSTSTTGITNGTSTIGKLTAYIMRMTQAKFRTNFIACDPVVWANLLLNTETNAGYNLPNIVTVSADGQVRILGIPVYPVNWLTGGRILTGDSRRAKIVQSEGLVLRQTDSHASTFVSNEVTFLLERTENLAIFRPDAFQTAVM